ncbi:MAG: hypothetical protein HY870_04340 [Chloroflexi bacterium]|nr:hypothetical protein [Chloroflexota bacterium]
MHFFRRRQTRSTHTNSAPLIYENNRALLEGKRETLVQPEEALDNLAASVGITRPEGCGCAGCMGCASVYMIILTRAFIALGALMMVMGIGWLLYYRHLEPNTAIPALFLVFGAILLTPGGGPQYILGSQAAEQYRVYLRGLYNQLLAHGQIVEGTIVSVEPVMVGQVITKQVLIHYRFAVPSQCENCEGQYKLLPKRTFEPGEKVTVLYLSRFIQVLL